VVGGSVGGGVVGGVVGGSVGGGVVGGGVVGAGVVGGAVVVGDVGRGAVVVGVVVVGPVVDPGAGVVGEADAGGTAPGWVGETGAAPDVADVGDLGVVAPVVPGVGDPVDEGAVDDEPVDEVEPIVAAVVGSSVAAVDVESSTAGVATGSFASSGAWMMARSTWPPCDCEITNGKPSASTEQAAITTPRFSTGFPSIP